MNQFQEATTQMTKISIQKSTQGKMNDKGSKISTKSNKTKTVIKLIIQQEVNQK